MPFASGQQQQEEQQQQQRLPCNAAGFGLPAASPPAATTMAKALASSSSHRPAMVPGHYIKVTKVHDSMFHTMFGSTAQLCMCLAGGGYGVVWLCQKDSKRRLASNKWSQLAFSEGHSSAGRSSALSMAMVAGAACEVGRSSEGATDMPLAVA